MNNISKNILLLLLFSILYYDYYKFASTNIKFSFDY
jgi:hypothetical protein